MTDNNKIYELPKTATISYFNEAEWNKDLSVEELKQQSLISESYLMENEAQVRGYGPCKGKANCNCSCDKIDECRCRLSIELSAYDEGDFQAGVYKNSLEGKIGWDGVELETEQSISLFKRRNGQEEAKFISPTAGGTISFDGDEISAKAKVGVDLVSYENTDGLKARVGVNIDTGGSIGDNGIEAKFLGFGISLGKKNGISTPFFEVSKEDDNCVIQ